MLRDWGVLGFRDFKVQGLGFKDFSDMFFNTPFALSMFTVQGLLADSWQGLIPKP